MAKKRPTKTQRATQTQKPASSASQFRFRTGDSVGYSAAEDDDRFLQECFVDTGTVSQLTDTTSPRFILVGRTGAGKTALLMHINRGEERCALLSPEDLAVSHVANTTILGHLRSVGVNLTPFYKLLWRQILTEELLRMVVRTPTQYTNILDRFLDRGGERSKQRRAAEYLSRWEKRFWDDTQERVIEVVSALEKSVRSSLGADIEMLNAGIDSVSKMSELKKRELARKCENVISDTKIQQLAGVFDLLNELLTDRQKPHYVLVDKLDESWVPETERYILTLAMISTIQEMNRRVRNAKIVVAIRRDLLEKVFREGREAGFQREKFESLLVPLAWSRTALLDVLDRRIDLLVRSRYTQKPVTHRELLPPKIHGEPIGAFLASHASRPRDIIHFFNACIEIGVEQPKFEVEDVRRALGPYSRLRFDALMEEWYELHPQLKLATGVLKGMPAAFRLDKILPQVDDLCLSISAEAQASTGALGDVASNTVQGIISPEEALKHLAILFYDVGLVGLKLQRQDTYQWVDENSRAVSSAEVTLSVSLKVHPAYRRALGTTEQYS